MNDSDSIYIGKYLLTGYMELLRSGTDWKGTVKDVEITDGGIKLSWNNSVSTSLEDGHDSLKVVLERVSGEKNP